MLLVKKQFQVQLEFKNKEENNSVVCWPSFVALQGGLDLLL